MTGHNRIRLLTLFLTVSFITGNSIPCKKGGSGKTGGQSNSTGSGSQGTPGLNVTINNINQIGNGSGRYGYDYDYDYSYVPVEQVPQQPKAQSYCGPNTVTSVFSFVYCTLDGIKRFFNGGI